MSDRAYKKLTIIQPQARHGAAKLAELRKFIGYYPFLFREITMKKWKNTFLGFWWLIIRPLVPTVMAVVTFTFIVPMKSDGLPYAVFYLSGFLIWNLFQATISFMPRTMLWMRGIMKKTYFPRILVPLASVGPPCVEFLVVGTLLAIAVIGYFAVDGVLYIGVGWRLLLFPLCVLMTLAFAVAIGMFFSLMALFVRDVIFTVSYFTQLAMFATPVIYPASLVPQPYRDILFCLNPMASTVEAARVALTGSGTFDPFWFALACVETILVAALSVWFFQRAEPVLQDAL